MAAHIAILQQPYLNMILRGQKTVESRITRQALPPFRQIAPGDRIYLKQSAGPYLASAIAGEVTFFGDLTPARMRDLKQRYNHLVGGNDDYWQSKSKARFATFITLSRVVPVDRGPQFPPSTGRAWFVLTDAQAATAPRIAEVTLTDGAMRNGYLRINGGARSQLNLPADEADTPLRLDMPDGRCIETSLNARGLVRWRGWSPLYEQHSARPGDVISIVERTPGRYRVVLHAQQAAAAAS